MRRESDTARITNSANILSAAERTCKQASHWSALIPSDERSAFSPSTTPRVSARRRPTFARKRQSPSATASLNSTNVFGDARTSRKPACWNNGTSRRRIQPEGNRSHQAFVAVCVNTRSAGSTVSVDQSLSPRAQPTSKIPGADAATKRSPCPSSTTASACPRPRSIAYDMPS